MGSRAPGIALCVALASFLAACVAASYRQVPPPVPQGAADPGGGAAGLPQANDDDITADVASWGPPADAAAPPDAALQFSDDPVARGKYLVDAGDCVACHTAAGGRPFAGARGIRTPFGIIYSANITPDVKTGIGGWTDDQIARAVRDGVGADDQLLMPPMPFGSFARMSDDDLHAVVAYLRTVPPVKNAVDRGKNHFSFGVRFAKSMGFIHHKPAVDVQAPPTGDRVKYGEYLAHGIAICHDCHSLTGKGPSDANLFAGAEDPMEDPAWGKVYPRNLTTDRETGLGNYTAEQIKQALRAGRRLDGKTMAPPMSGFIPHFSGMTDEDLDAIIAYLQAIPAKKHKVPERTLTPAAKRLVGEAG
jgi:mono/diheme cytochrome c family protein